MKLPTEWPHRVKNGNVTIPIYRSRTSRGYTEFKVVWVAQGKRRFKTFADFEKAKKHASSVNDAFDSGSIASTVLSGDERVIYYHAQNALKELNIPLNIAAQEYAFAVQQVGADKFREAIQRFAQMQRGVQSKSVQAVVNEFLQEKEKPSQPNKRAASARYLTDMRCRLNRFAKAFVCDMNTVSADQVKDFLASLSTTKKRIGGRTYVNYARAIATLFNFAKAKSYFPRDLEPLDGIDTDFEDEGEIEIFTPREATELLRHASEDLLPFIAIGAFAGLRHAELLRLDWSEVKSDSIEVKKAKAKTRSRRLVPIQPNLQKWLAPLRKDSGPVVPFKSMFRVVQNLTAASGVKWKQNGLRHSFCSYRYADVKNENIVAMEAGNSPQKLFSNYRELVSETDAKNWFGINPPAAPKIVGMPSEKAA
jgi:integrase